MYFNGNVEKGRLSVAEGLFPCRDTSALLRHRGTEDTLTPLYF